VDNPTKIISVEDLAELIVSARQSDNKVPNTSPTELAASRQRRADVMLRLAILEDRERSTVN